MVETLADSSADRSAFAKPSCRLCYAAALRSHFFQSFGYAPACGIPRSLACSELGVARCWPRFVVAPISSLFARSRLLSSHAAPDASFIVGGGRSSAHCVLGLFKYERPFSRFFLRDFLGVLRDEAGPASHRQLLAISLLCAFYYMLRSRV